MERTGAVTFVVRVMPRASRDAIEGGHGCAMKVTDGQRSAAPLAGRIFERACIGC